MRDFLNRWKKCPEPHRVLPALERWFDGTRGQAIYASQQLRLDELLAEQFGYHLLQLSVDSRIRLFEGSRVQYKYRGHPFSDDADTLCNFEQLPFATESMDVVVLHHAHEFVNNPHAVLREIQRVVIANGLLVVTGFNPWSLQGLHSTIGHFLPGSIWQNHLISTTRMKDWLSLLGFETALCQYGSHCSDALEYSNNPLLKRFFRHWPLGNYYVITAIKQEAGMTPQKPRWKTSRPGFAGLAPIKPRISGRSTRRPLHFPPGIKEDVA